MFTDKALNNFGDMLSRFEFLCKKTDVPYNAAAQKPVNSPNRPMDYSKAKELLKLQQQAQKIQEELSNTHIEAEVDGVVVTFDGQLKCVAVKIENPEVLKDLARTEKAFLEAINKGLRKSQEIAAEKMRGIMGSMGLELPPGFAG